MKLTELKRAGEFFEGRLVPGVTDQELDAFFNSFIVSHARGTTHSGWGDTANRKAERPVSCFYKGEFDGLSVGD